MEDDTENKQPDKKKEQEKKKRYEYPEPVDSSMILK